MNQQEKIVSAAAEMFLDEGIKSVRMDDIALRLGVSKRTLYEIFGDKQNLLEQSVVHLMCQKHNLLKERVKGAANVMEEMFISIETMKQQDREGVLIVNLRKFYPEIFDRLEHEARRHSHDRFDELLSRGVQQGLLLADMDKELALLTITFTINALFDKKTVNFAPLKDISMQRALKYVITNFLRGLATKRGIEVIDELAEKY